VLDKPGDEDERATPQHDLAQNRDQFFTEE
jgi:hypothetical protein